MPKQKLWLRKSNNSTRFSLEHPSLKFPPIKRDYAGMLAENQGADNRRKSENENYGFEGIYVVPGYLPKIRQLGLPTRKGLRKIERQIIETLLNFSFGILSFAPKKNYGFEKLIIVPALPSNIRHSNFHQLGLPTRKFGRKIDWQTIGGLPNNSFGMSITKTMVSKK